MAEAAVAIVINKATAAKPLLQGHHLQEHVSWMKTQMKTLQSYLKDAESKKATTFINSIRDLALDMEDFLDSYLPEIESHKSKGPLGFLEQCSCSLCFDVARSDLSLKMEEFKKRAAEIEKSEFGIAVESGTDGEIWKRTNELEKKFIGRKDIVQKIEAEVLSVDKKCRTISIVGTGGVGKTTVATEIYRRLKGKFECGAMVSVSKESTFLEIIFDIAKQVGLSQSQMKHHIHENLYLVLREKRYMIFLDDIGLDKWDALKDIIMTDKRKGSRIIVTCREPEVLKSHKEFRLDLLSEREGKNLLYDTLEETVSPELKRIGDKIVKKCGGLPLAIQLAAGLLKARGSNERSWNEVLTRISQGGENDSVGMILELSYQDLSTKLKPFFLYFGVFPANREIIVAELISFWVAEKLVIQADESHGKPEKIVEELIARNLIQVIRRKSDTRIKSCGIQNLLHELCIRKGEEINFFSTWSNLRKVDSASTARRVITNSSGTLSDQSNMQSFTVPRKLRTLLCYDKGTEVAMFIKNCASELRFLQLLTIEVENKGINLPVEIADLSGLIHLKLKGQYIRVPSSVRRLKKLQTLEIRAREIPDSVLKMKYLKHLFMTAVKIKNIRGGAGELEVDLQNLETLESDFQYGFHLNRSTFKKLPSLKKLIVLGVEKQTLEDLSDTKPLLRNLEDLRLRVDLISSIPKVDLSAYENLRVLHLDSSINIAPLFEFPKKLVKISLERFDTQDKDPLEKLRKLPCLETIKLEKCKLRMIDFSGHGSFPQLQKIILFDTKFHHMTVDGKGMPKLSKFVYKAHSQQPPEALIPEELRKVMVEIDNHGLIRPSTTEAKFELRNLLSSPVGVIQNSYEKFQFSGDSIKSCWKWITMG